MDTEIRVLIADDEQIARETMRDYLPWAEMGMQTPICVENGALALDHLCHDKIDIFIMDIRMPIMDGMALLEEITRRNIDVLIIVLSAYDQFEYAQKAISSRKVFEYVLKPIRRGNFCTLLQKAAAAVRSKRAESSPDSQALYDEVRKNYNGFLMQGHTAEGIALVRQKLEALPEPWSDWEGKKRFLIALYTDTQLEAVKQSTKNGQPYGRRAMADLCVYRGRTAAVPAARHGGGFQSQRRDRALPAGNRRPLYGTHLLLKLAGGGNEAEPQLSFYAL